MCAVLAPDAASRYALSCKPVADACCVCCSAAAARLATVALSLHRLPVRLTIGPDRRHLASVPASLACGNWSGSCMLHILACSTFGPELLLGKRPFLRASRHVVVFAVLHGSPDCIQVADT